MVASIGKIGSLSRGVGYFEKDGYYARDEPGAPGEARSWAGKGAEVLGLAGPRSIPTRTATWPPGPRRQYTAPAGCDLTLSAPKSASLLALVSGDERR